MKCIYSGYCFKGNCTSSCVRGREMNYMLSKSGIPEKRQKIMSLSPPAEDEKAYDKLKKISKSIVSYVDCGYNIILQSPKTGNGKTTWAIQLMISYFNAKWAGNGFKERGRFLYVPEYLSRVKSAMKLKDDELDEINSVIKDIDVLILDDLGATQMSEFDVALLSTIIDQRALKEKTIIMTTNCDKQKLAEMIGQRMVDRLYGHAVTITFRGESHRGL